MRNKKYFLFIIVTVIFLAGCFNKKSTLDNRIEQNIKQSYEDRGRQVEVNVDTEKGEVMFESKEEGVVIKTSEQGNLDLPDDWPQEVEVYPGGKLVAVIKNPEGTQITIQTDDSVDKVKEWYSQKMKDTAWQKKMNFDVGGSWMVSYQKDDYQLVFSVTPDEEEGGVIVNINYAQAR